MLTWSRRMFPGTNLQDLNLDWILRKVAALRGGSTGQYLYKKSDKDFDFGWKTGGGGGGTSDYLDLDNKPSINNVELTGNKTASDLGLATPSDIPSVPVQSVNGKTGAVVLSASDVGAYVKPAAGIPKTDLASAVQTSLDKADTALQAVPPTYRTATEQDMIDAAQDTQINTLAGSLAMIESSPATTAHVVGEYIVYNGHLYIVTVAIASGETLTVGTNIAVTSVDKMLHYTEVTGVETNVQFQLPKYAHEVYIDCTFPRGQHLNFYALFPASAYTRIDSGFYYNDTTCGAGAVSVSEDRSFILYKPYYAGTELSAYTSIRCWYR